MPSKVMAYNPMNPKTSALAALMVKDRREKDHVTGDALVGYYNEASKVAEALNSEGKLNGLPLEKAMALVREEMRADAIKLHTFIKMSSWTANHEYLRRSQKGSMDLNELRVSDHAGIIRFPEGYVYSPNIWRPCPCRPVGKYIWAGGMDLFISIGIEF